jgi:hypothetical protein
MSKHTPGPWQAFDNGTYFEIRSGRESLGDACASKYQESGDNSEANAVLMAAAPQLLADLTDAAAQLRKYETLHRAKGTPDSLEKADVNGALAARFEATIAAAVGGAE